MNERGVTRRAFAAGAVGALAIGGAAGTAGVAGAQEETTTSAGGGSGDDSDSDGDGDSGGEDDSGGETTQHGDESFRLGRDLQVLLAAVVLAVLSPIAFAVVLFARGDDRGRGPAT